MPFTNIDFFIQLKSYDHHIYVLKLCNHFEEIALFRCLCVYTTNIQCNKFT